MRNSASFSALFVAASLLPFAAPGAAVTDGFAVAVVWRGGNCNWAGCAPENRATAPYWPRGVIIRANIQGSSVVSRDTIYKDIGQYPLISWDGRKAAFFRTNIFYGTDAQGKTTVRTEGEPHISIMNPDGSGLVDLCAIPGNPGIENSMDWPVGDWIYYVKPIVGGKYWGCSGSIWKVNAVTKVNQEVVTYTTTTTEGPPWLRRFTLSKDGRWAAIQAFDPGVNHISCFPPSGTDVQSACHVQGSPGCNIAISCSGRYQGTYLYAPHAETILTELDPATGKYVRWAFWLPRLPDLKTWSPGLCLDNGSGAEQIRWAVNSDRWWGQNVGWYGHADTRVFGSNAVWADWVGKKAFCVSNCPKLPKDQMNIMYYGSDAGHFFLNIPVGQYEDSSGVLRTMPGYQTTTTIDLSPSSLSFSAGQGGCNPDPKTVIAVVNAKGRTVYRDSWTGERTVDLRALGHGVFFVTVRAAGGKTKSETIIHEH